MSKNEQEASKQWSGRTDGFSWMHQSLIWMLKYVDIRSFYFISDVVVMFYMAFCYSRTSAIYHFFRRRLGKKTLPAVMDVYQTYRQFGYVIIDRFAAFAGRRFSFRIRGLDEFEEAVAKKSGCLMISSHAGNYELSGYFLHSSRNIFVLSYGGEKTSVLKNRQRMFEKNKIRSIYLQDDWSHLYKIQEILSNGDILTLFGDRLLGSTKTIRCNVLQTPARLPLGPFVLAELYKNSPVFCIFVMRDAGYNVFIKKIEGQTRDQYAAAFADELSEVIKQYPHQWFNFYEFWDEV